MKGNKLCFAIKIPDGKVLGAPKSGSGEARIENNIGCSAGDKF